MKFFLLLAAGALVAGCTVPMTIQTVPEPSSDTEMAPPVPKKHTAHRKGLDPELRRAVQQATRAAAADGIQMKVTSGWRSKAHQRRLLDEAVARYGSLEEALRFVSTPDNSAHVTGDAVDIGPTEADVWLEQHGATWGLCRMFANEMWHFELATTPGGTCPEMLPDSSYRNR
ncbi:D-alanyl-D-alanine carboxypeptidase [Marmoricola sp. OAE513]|uniref:M15 family metallopeptidase n=1 Tax=Marmoricola sp. OAE513 TaxID=2817894 RepID=UPI001AE9FADF